MEKDAYEMEKDADDILKSLKQYESQLQQVRKAIKSTSNDSDNNDLLALENDIQELISLTKETLSNLPRSSVEEVVSSSTDTKQDSFSDEYALFKAELAELEESYPEGHSGTGTKPFKTEDTNSNTCNPESDNDYNADGLTELQEELDALKGSKCQAPHKQQWGDISYHNALIMEIETNDRVNNIDHIQVRVMFVNPTERDMLPCPYFLDGECRFSDDKCHFSHGHLVPVSKIKEFREPDFTSLKKGSQILAKQKDNLWHRAKVEDILNNNQCLIQFESKGCELVELDLQDILPLEPGNKDEDGSESSSDSEEDVLPQEYFVQLSLLRTPPSLALGAWEKHTKGIGSRLMANMGYVIGCGLGKHGEGRLEPVEAMAYPPGKSLDACMALREAAGGDQNMFKAEQRQKKQARQLLRLQQRQNQRKYGRKDVFSFINSKLSGSLGSKPEEESNKVALSSSSRKGLNVERFRLGENIKKMQKDITKLNQSLKRHEVGSTIHNTLTSKLKEAQSELNTLQNNDNLVAKEQDQREGRKKITVF